MDSLHYYLTHNFIIPKEVPVSSLCWSYCCVSNALVHSLNGNRRFAYRIGCWNCRKKLISSNSFDTNKLTDIKAYFARNDPHVFAIIESDLFGVNSACNRNQKFTTEEVHSKLQIEGFHIVLPKSGECHGLARIIVYVKDEVKAKVVDDHLVNSDLQSLSLEVGLGREKKTLVNFFYREWKGCVSKLNCQASQIQRLIRQIDHWKQLSASNNDVLVMGDANVCAFKWNDEDYNLKNISNHISDFL